MTNKNNWILLLFFLTMASGFTSCAVLKKKEKCDCPTWNKKDKH